MGIGRRVRRKVRMHAAWWHQAGVRLYYGDPFCLLGVVDLFGKPGKRYIQLPLYPAQGVDHWELVEQGAEMLLKKSDAPTVGAAANVTLVDVKFQKPYPTLWTYLTQTTWEDDTERRPSGLTVFLQDGVFKGLLKENEQNLCLWVTATSFFGLLDALEAALNTPAPDWRVDRRQGGGVAKKGRK